MSLPTPQAWLYSWVDTDAVGYRRATIAGTAMTVAAGFYRWPEYLSAIDSAASAIDAAYGCTPNGTGGVRFDGAATIEWPDRMGWILGMGGEPGSDEGSASTVYSRIVAPGAVPLLSATWDIIDRKSESRLMVDRHMRGHGYLYGGADVFRWRILVHTSALESFRSGFCLSGKVTMAATAPGAWAGATAWSKSNPGGYLDGYVLGVTGGKWLDPTRTIWEASILIAAEVAT